MQHISNVCTHVSHCAQTSGKLLTEIDIHCKNSTNELKKFVERPDFSPVFVTNVVKGLKVALPILFFYQAPLTVTICAALSITATYVSNFSSAIENIKEIWRNITPSFQQALLICVIASYHVVPILAITTLTNIVAGAYTGVLIRDSIEVIKEFNRINNENISDQKDEKE